MKKLVRTFGALWLIGALGVTQLAIVTPAHAAPMCFGKPATIVGQNEFGSGERIVGTPGTDVIVGRRGDDRILGRGGNDRICGGEGQDRIKGGGGRDRIEGGYNRCPEERGYFEVLEGNAGRDLIQGSSCHDKAYGGKGHDIVRGNGSILEADELFGGPGDDDLTYSPDDCDCHAGAWFSGGPGDDALNGAGFGLARVTYEDAAGPVHVDLGAQRATGEGTDTFVEIDSAMGSPFADTLEGSNLFGAGGADRILGTDGDDALGGGGGNDEIVAGDGNDALTGGGGNDVLDAGSGDDGLEGGLGDDRINGGEGIDELTFFEPDRPVHVDLALGEATGHGRDSIEGIENLIGSKKNDVLRGDDGPNVIQDCCRAKSTDLIDGRGGNDRLLSGWGRDTVDGGPGDDTIFGDYGDDTLDGGEGIDEIDGSNGTDTCTNGEVISNCES